MQYGTNWNGISLQATVSQTRLIWKMLGIALTWVCGEALFCLIWLLMSVILSHFCHLDTFSAEKTRPGLSSLAYWLLTRTWFKQETHCGIWEKLQVSAVYPRAPSISASLWCLQALSKWRGGGRESFYPEKVGISWPWQRVRSDKFCFLLLQMWRQCLLPLPLPFTWLKSFKETSSHACPPV